MKQEYTPKQPPTRRRGRAARALPVVGATMLAGIATVGILPSTNAQAAVVPAAHKVNSSSSIGPGEIIDYAKKAYTAYKVADCIGGGKADLISCLVSAGEAGGPTTADVYNKLTELSASFDKYQVQYKKDHQAVMQTLGVISADQKETALSVQVAQLRDDSERAHVAVTMAGALTDCSAKVLSPDAARESCDIFDSNGLKLRTKPATIDTLNDVKHRFLEQNFDDGGIGRDRYLKSPAVYSQILAGTPETGGDAKIADIDPYRQSGVLRWTLDKANAAEVARQGFPVGTQLTVLPASYVNSAGHKVSQIIDEESGYYMTRILAAKLAGRDDQAQSLLNLSEHGRQDSSPVPSIAEQREIYQFPGWTSTTPLQPNQYLLRGQRSGLAKVTVNQGATPADDATLPTGEQVTKLADDMGFSGTHYSSLTKTDPAAFPALAGQLPGPYPAVARYYTKARNDVVATDAGFYTAGTGPQLYLINHRDELFHTARCRDTGQACVIPLSVGTGASHLVGPTNVVFLQTATEQKEIKGRRAIGYTPWVPGVVRGLTVPAGFARTASQDDLSKLESLTGGNVYAMAPQLPGHGHYDGAAYPALSINIQPMSRGGALLPVG